MYLDHISTKSRQRRDPPSPLGTNVHVNIGCKKYSIVMNFEASDQ